MPNFQTQNTFRTLSNILLKPKSQKITEEKEEEEEEEEAEEISTIISQ